ACGGFLCFGSMCLGQRRARQGQTYRLQPIRLPPGAEPKEAHHFSDKENDWLFAGVGAARTLDYFSTLNFRRRGNGHFDCHFLPISPLRPSQNGALDFHPADRRGDNGAARNDCLKTAHPAVAPGSS
ncbi:MAG: hypothetical protein ABSH39_17155, partial [Candidatus Acidiferrum sp.]